MMGFSKSNMLNLYKWSERSNEFLIIMVNLKSVHRFTVHELLLFFKWCYCLINCLNECFWLFSDDKHNISLFQFGLAQVAAQLYKVFLNKLLYLFHLILGSLSFNSRFATFCQSFLFSLQSFNYIIIFFFHCCFFIFYLLNLNPHHLNSLKETMLKVNFCSL